ncbi:MAG: hypothetical protein EBZ22_06020 [Flavobacteriia bacterium]|nr:hypothetical protein [Flavobacteriia bacterium]
MGVNQEGGKELKSDIGHGHGQQEGQFVALHPARKLHQPRLTHGMVDAQGENGQDDRGLQQTIAQNLYV